MTQDRAALTAQIAELQAKLAAMDTVDPLLIEAREIAASAFSAEKNDYHAQKVRAAKGDDFVPVVVALAALRRGMELARVPVAPWPGEDELRDMARQAAAKVLRTEPHSISAIGEGDDEYDTALEMARRLKARILPDGEQSA
jgi:hypothetical protein